MGNSMLNLPPYSPKVFNFYQSLFFDQKFVFRLLKKKKKSFFELQLKSY